MQKGLLTKFLLFNKFARKPDNKEMISVELIEEQKLSEKTFLHCVGNFGLAILRWQFCFGNFALAILRLQFCACQLTCLDGSIENVGSQRFWDPGSTPAGVEIFCTLNF